MLDVAVKYHGEDTCYVHTSEIFFQSGRPKSHGLDGNEYDVEITVKSENEATSKVSFKVYNTGIQVCFTYLGRLPNLFK